MTDPGDMPEQPQQSERLFFSETAGQTLASARERWHLSVAEVAESLNLSVHIIEAIEADDYDKLPGATFTKGYIRAYANILRLDADELVDMVDVEPDEYLEIPSEKSAIKLKGKTYNRGSSRGGSLKFLIWVLLLAGVLLFGLNQWSQLDVKNLAEVFKFPVADSIDSGQGEGENQILFPAEDNSGSESGDQSTSN